MGRSQNADAIHRPRFSDYLARARKVAGDLERRVRFGEVWSGVRTVRIAPDAIVRVQIVDNFKQGQPDVKAELFTTATPRTPLEVEDIQSIQAVILVHLHGGDVVGIASGAEAGEVLYTPIQGVEVGEVESRKVEPRASGSWVDISGDLDPPLFVSVQPNGTVGASRHIQLTADQTPNDIRWQGKIQREVSGCLGGKIYGDNLVFLRRQGNTVYLYEVGVEDFTDEEFVLGDLAPIMEVFSGSSPVSTAAFSNQKIEARLFQRGASQEYVVAKIEDEWQISTVPVADGTQLLACDYYVDDEGEEIVLRLWADETTADDPPSMQVTDDEGVGGPLGTSEPVTSTRTWNRSFPEVKVGRYYITPQEHNFLPEDLYFYQRAAQEQSGFFSSTLEPQAEGFFGANAYVEIATTEGEVNYNYFTHVDLRRKAAVIVKKTSTTTSIEQAVQFGFRPFTNPGTESGYIVSFRTPASWGNWVADDAPELTPFQLEVGLELEVYHEGVVAHSKQASLSGSHAAWPDHWPEQAFFGTDFRTTMMRTAFWPDGTWRQERTYYVEKTWTEEDVDPVLSPPYSYQIRPRAWASWYRAPTNFVGPSPTPLSPAPTISVARSHPLVYTHYASMGEDWLVVYTVPEWKAFPPAGAEYDGVQQVRDSFQTALFNGVDISYLFTPAEVLKVTVLELGA